MDLPARLAPLKNELSISTEQVEVLSGDTPQVKESLRAADAYRDFLDKVADSSQVLSD